MGAAADPSGVALSARPGGVTALAMFFGAGALIAFTSAVALSFPGGVLEPMWRLNPRAREAFASLGGWSVALMAIVSAACLAASVGLWLGAAWGRRVAVAVLSVNLLGDLANALLGIEPRAAAGVPIAAALLAYLVRATRVRRYFGADRG
jgi:hypothetical protein